MDGVTVPYFSGVIVPVRVCGRVRLARFFVAATHRVGTARALLVSVVCWFIWELSLIVFGLLDATLIRIKLPATWALHFLQTLSVGVAFRFLRLRFGSILASGVCARLAQYSGHSRSFFAEEANLAAAILESFQENVDLSVS